MFMTFLLFVSPAIALASEASDAIGERIMRGEDASITEFPGMLSLEDAGEHICGAVIMSERWAITAAHCIEKARRESDLTLIAGSSFLDKGGERHHVEYVVKHPKFDDRIHNQYDIALIKVSDPFIFNEDSVQPVTLASEGEVVPENSEAIIPSWTTPRGVITSVLGSKRLKKMYLTVLADATCRYRQSHGIDDYKTVYCAEASSALQGVCKGDAGSPLFVKGKVVGLLAWVRGLSCSWLRKPAIFTRIAAYRKWIQEVTGV